MRTYRHRFVLLAVRLFIVALFSLCLINAPASLCRQAMAAGWVTDTIDSAGDVGTHTSLAFDGSGYPAISYYDVTNGNLKFARYRWSLLLGGYWYIQTVDSGGDGWEVGKYTSLAFDPSGNPAISHIFEYGTGSYADLKFARYNGATWDITFVNSEWPVQVGYFSSLAFDPSGNPSISYYDWDNWNLKFARYDSVIGNWGITTVDSAGVVGGYSSLAFDPSGNPAISYWDETNGNLKYAHFNGATWDITTLDSAGYVGEYSSLAFDPSGNPAISYFDATNGDLKFMGVVWRRPCQWCMPGWVWQRTTVDSAGYVGGYSSLAFDGSGNPAISYFEYANFDYINYDFTYTDLKYARFNGATWDITTVDSAGYVGEYSSLAFDPSGNPSISYYDYTNGNLKYAHYVPDPTTTTTSTTTTTTTSTTTTTIITGLPPQICHSICPLAFSVRQGRTKCKSFRVWNCGKGTLNWTVSEDCNWLTLSPSSGTSTGEKDIITACVNTAGLAKGDYECTVTITGEEASNSPQTCVIRLRVR